MQELLLVYSYVQKDFDLLFRFDSHPEFFQVQQGPFYLPFYVSVCVELFVFQSLCTFRILLGQPSRFPQWLFYCLGLNEGLKRRRFHAQSSVVLYRLSFFSTPNVKDKVQLQKPLHSSSIFNSLYVINRVHKEWVLSN